MTVLRDLNKLNTFVRVAERRSFTRAAADLRTTPSVVSNRMRELEEALGFSLMNRSTHGIALTDAGDGLYRHCLEMLERVDSYVTEERCNQSGVFGTLRVQASPFVASCVLAPAITEFMLQRPSMRIYLSSVEEGSESTEDGFDIVVTCKKPTAPGLVGDDLGGIPYVICGSPSYFRANGRPSSPKELRGQNCLVNPYSRSKEWPFRVDGKPAFIAVKGNQSTNSDNALVSLARGGCGLIRVPRQLVNDELEHGLLEAVLEDSILSPERIGVWYSKAKSIPAKTTEFIRFIRSWVSNPASESRMKSALVVSTREN